MRVFEESENADIFASTNNQIRILEGILAVSQVVKSRMEAQRGEMIYAVNDGMPLDETVWSGTPNLQQFEFFARQIILGVPDVIGIQTFEAEIIGDVLTYTANITTSFGETVTSGSI